MAVPNPPLRISVVTPSFNQGKFIERTIRSVIDQGYPSLEYIIVDGGSTDDTMEIVKKYETHLRWISEPDQGQSDAINKGLRMATGDILCYLNSDDILLPGSLQTVADAFQQHPTSQWLTGYCTNIDADDKPIQSFARTYKNFLLRHYRSWTLVTINYISQMSTFWRRSAQDRIGLFSINQHLVMDYDYWLRMQQLGQPIILQKDLSAFRIHQMTKSTNRYVQQFQESANVAMSTTHNPLLKALSWGHHYVVIFVYKIFSLRS